ncbi:MAG TPA: MASE1 domain-containing protein, partial [Polyangiaceae bacterium]|nr:MASE1 domain-containing protein [Polyangiaceae bacterium]
VATAKLGLTLDPVNGFASLVWPPTGIALGVLARKGSGLWPAVALGAFAANLSSGAAWPVAAGIALGNTLEALLGAQLLARVDGASGPMRRVSHALAFLAAALCSPLLAASVGTLSLWAGGVVPLARATDVWLAWWLGDVLGALVLGPLLLNTARGDGPVGSRPGALEAALAIVAVLGSAALSFSGEAAAPLRRPHMIFPALIWTALRFGPSVASGAVLVISAIAIAITARGAGPYVAAATLHENLTVLQGFMGTVALTALFLSAAAVERATALRKLGEKHARLDAIAEATSDSLTIKDLDGRYVLANPAHARRLGSAPDAVVGKSDHDFFPPDVARPLLDNDRLARGSEGAVLSEEILLVDGEPRTFSSAKAPYRIAGELLGNISISRDVTQQKMHERDLRTALGARDEFLSIASHELRTPLAALSLQVAGLERALQRRGAQTEESQRELHRAGRAVAHVERLTRLVDNLFDVSQITAGRLQLQREPCDLADAVRAVVGGLMEQAARAGCTVSVAAPASLGGYWDRFRIEQAITNLLTNAFKYGAGRPVEVSLEATDACASLRVRDHGIGIAPDATERIFERFERVATGHHRKSLGVGLYIARQVIDAHAGVVRVESSSPEGSTFLVELPRRSEDLRPSLPPVIVDSHIEQ